LLTRARQLNEQAEELSEIADTLRHEARRLRSQAAAVTRATKKANAIKRQP